LALLRGDFAKNHLTAFHIGAFLAFLPVTACCKVWLATAFTFACQQTSLRFLVVCSWRGQNWPAIFSEEKTLHNYARTAKRAICVMAGRLAAAIVNS